MTDSFSIRGEGSMNFVADKKTGKWLLAKGSPPEILGLSKPHPFCTYLGTHLIVVNVSRICNLKCKYCFAGEIKGLQKMSRETGRKCIDRVLELPEQNRHVVFHGNEPMTNFDVIEDSALYANSKKDGKICFSMQSNGTLFTEERINRLKTLKVGIGISLDGLERHHNFNRPYDDNRGSYSDVISNLNKIKNIQGGISVITVITRENVEDLKEIVDNYSQLGIDSVCFNPAYPGKTDEYCPPQDQLIKSMTALFDSEIKREISGKRGTSVINLRDILRGFFSPRISVNCVRCSGTPVQPLIGIDIDGSIYPCDLFWEKEEYKIGNIQTMDLLSSLNSKRNFRTYRNVDGIESCVDCDWLTFCGGECPGISVSCGNGIASRGYYCEYRKSMLEYAAKKIELLYNERILEKVLGYKRRE